jgi:NDP-sugar pyrophosphorylase family protein
MKAFLLAAGEGQRLRPFTAARPKPMIEVHGRPLLEYNVRALAALGVVDIVINTHYRADAIQSYFGDGAAWGVRIAYSFEPELLGTAGALLPVAAQLDQTFILVYGDNLTDCDLRRVVARHRAAGALATIAVFERPDVLASGIVGIDDAGRVTRFLEKPRPDEVFSHWVNAGIMVFEPGVLDFIPRGRPSDIGRDVLPAILAAGAPIAAYQMDEHLWWIDSTDDYARTLADPELARFAARLAAAEAAADGHPDRSAERAGEITGPLAPGSLTSGSLT